MQTQYALQGQRGWRRLALSAGGSLTPIHLLLYSHVWEGMHVLNGPERAEFWRSFIPAHCAYPAPVRLCAQLTAAEFHSFCNCGCNSFAVRIPLGADVLPLTLPGDSGGMFFEADFDLAPNASLEILLFVDGAGNLSFIEIDLNGNSEPVPDAPDIIGLAHHAHISVSLLPD